MFLLILGAVFALLALVAIGLQRTYYHIPAKELKRRARSGDTLADFLYRPVSYGVSLKALLWILIIVFSALSFVCFARATAPWFSFFLIAFFIWLGFLWIPSSQLTGLGARLAIWCTPVITWLVRVLHPVLDKAAVFVRKHRPLHVHTGLYQKEDLVQLLERQKDQPDNRIAPGEITLLTHALSFGDKLVSDAMVPRRAVRMVSGQETVGPLLMDELHKSGYSRFPVYDDDQNQVVGTLYMKDMLRARSGGKIANIVRPDMYYVHEDFTLYEALQAFLKTKHHLFIVVNSFEEIVGIITIEDILEQVIGRQIVDEFDQYDNMREVAAAAAKKDHAARKKAKEEPAEAVKTEETVVESKEMKQSANDSNSNSRASK